MSFTPEQFWRFGGLFSFEDRRILQPGPARVQVRSGRAGSLDTNEVRLALLSLLALLACLGLAMTPATGAEHRGPGLAAPAGIVVAQAEDEGVSHDEIQKYVAVYRAMQHNHRLTVEQAAETQGLTLQAFRDLEQRIERDDAARDEARQELMESARQPTPSGPGRSQSTPKSPP
jgi:hypothetical protein